MLLHKQGNKQSKDPLALFPLDTQRIKKNQYQANRDKIDRKEMLILELSNEALQTMACDKPLKTIFKTFKIICMGKRALVGTYTAY